MIETQNRTVDVPSPGVTLFIHSLGTGTDATDLREKYRILWRGWASVVDEGFANLDAPPLATLNEPGRDVDGALRRLLESKEPNFIAWGREGFPPLRDAVLTREYAAVITQPHHDLQVGTTAIVREYADHTAVVCFDRILIDMERGTSHHLDVPDFLEDITSHALANTRTVALFEAPSVSEFGRLLLQIGEFAGFAVGTTKGIVAAGICDILPAVLSWFLSSKPEPQPSIPDLVQINANDDKLKELGKAIIADAISFQLYYSTAWDDRNNNNPSGMMWRLEAYSFFFTNAGIANDAGLYLKLGSLENILDDIQSRAQSIGRMVAAEQALFAQCVALHRLGARVLYDVMMTAHHVDRVDAAVKEHGENLDDSPAEIIQQKTAWLSLLDTVVLPQSKAFEKKAEAVENAILEPRLKKIRFGVIDDIEEDRRVPDMPYTHHMSAAIIDDGDADLGQGRQINRYSENMYLNKKRTEVCPTPEMQRDFAAYLASVRSSTIARLYGHGLTEADNIKIREQQARLERIVKDRIALIAADTKKPASPPHKGAGTTDVSKATVSIQLQPSA